MKATTDGSYENIQFADFATFFEEIFKRNRFLDILKHFICFHVEGQNIGKLSSVFRSQKSDYFHKAATQIDGKGNVFWYI